MQAQQSPIRVQGREEDRGQGGNGGKHDHTHHDMLRHVQHMPQPEIEAENATADATEGIANAYELHTYTHEHRGPRSGCKTGENEHS